MTLFRFWWCCFVSLLVRRTYGFDPADHAVRRRQLASANTEVDRLRVAFVRAQELIRRMKQDAITEPSIPIADEVTQPAIRAAEEWRG